VVNGYNIVEKPAARTLLQPNRT